MDPASITALITAASSIFTRLFPDKSEQQKQQFMLELQKLVTQTDLAKGQMEINKAEASNPNRKWITWRELTGYLCAFGLGWAYLFQPMLVFMFTAAGYPLANLPAVDAANLILLLGSMLGVGGLSYIQNKQGTKK